MTARRHNFFSVTIKPDQGNDQVAQKAAGATAPVLRFLHSIGYGKVTFSDKVPDWPAVDLTAGSIVRIVGNTPSQLKLRDRSLWISILFWCIAAFCVADWALKRELSQLVPAALWVMFGFAFFRATDVTLDKIRRICVVRRRDVLHITRKQIAFSDIADVRVDLSFSDSAEEASCRLSLVTTNDVVPLTFGYEPDLKRYDAMRDAVLDVLFGDRPRPPVIDPVHMLGKTGRIIEAVVLLRKRDGLDLTTARLRVEELRNAPDAPPAGSIE
jgi:hypothetical protein